MKEKGTRLHNSDIGKPQPAQATAENRNSSYTGRRGRGKSNVRLRPLPGTLVHGHCRGGTFTKKYNAWMGAKARCLNRKHPSYPRYGGRGIPFFDAWREFAQFDRDMPDPPGPEYSLERRDPREGYTPWNCTWALPKEQARNKADTVIYRWNGIRGTFPELVEKAGVNYHAAYKRFRRMGWTLEEAFATPVRGWKRSAR